MPKKTKQEIAYFKSTKGRHGGKYGPIIVHSALRVDGSIMAVDTLRKTIRHNSTFGSAGMTLEVSTKAEFDKAYNEVNNRS